MKSFPKGICQSGNGPLSGSKWVRVSANSWWGTAKEDEDEEEAEAEEEEEVAEADAQHAPNL